MLLTFFVNGVHSLFDTPEIETNYLTASLMQAEGRVIESISGLQEGVIILQGIYWKARSENRAGFIPKGAAVSVTGRSNNILLVAPFVQPTL